MPPTTSAWPACSSSSTACRPASRTRPRPTRWRGTRDVPQRRAHAHRAGARRQPATPLVGAGDGQRRQHQYGSFQNEVLATGFNLPTTIKFLPDGRMLVVELQGTIKVLPPPYTQADPTPFLQLTNIGSTTGVQQGIYDIALDPELRDQPLLLRLLHAGRRTATASRASPPTPRSPARSPGSELILYQDPQNANAEHHGGAIIFGNDGKIYFTTGEHFQGTPVAGPDQPARQDPSHQPGRHGPDRQPVLRRQPGPTSTRSGRSGCAIPIRAYYDAPTGRLLIGDVGGNDDSTANEEVNLGARGANYGWPNVEGHVQQSACTSPIYSYPHNGRDAAITGGFVYHGTQFPSSYQGSYFFADYAQNWIKRLTFDAERQRHRRVQLRAGQRSGRRPVRRHRLSDRGPRRRALLRRPRLLRHQRHVRRQQDPPDPLSCSPNQAPVAAASANPTQGPTPLDVNFSSAGSSDPEGQAADLLVDLRRRHHVDRGQPDAHLHRSRPVQARLTVSDGVNTTLSTPLTISVGNRADGDDPVAAPMAAFVQGRRRDLLQRRRAPTPRTARCRPAPSPGTSTSCTKATCTRAPPSPA